MMLQREGGILSNGVGPLIPHNDHAIPAGADQLLAFRVKCQCRDRLVVQLPTAGQHSEAGVLHAPPFLAGA